MLAVKAPVRSALLCFLLACVVCHSANLPFCDEPLTATPTNLGVKDTNESRLISSVGSTIGLDVGKACVKMMEQKAEETNHYYVLGINESIILESEVCGRSTDEMLYFLNRSEWSVAQRIRNKHLPLFAFPVESAANWLQKKPRLNPNLMWTKIHTNPAIAGEFCITKSGQLKVKRFTPDLAGTYVLSILNGTDNEYATMSNSMLNHLPVTYHHLDYVFDSEDTFDGAPVRQFPVLAPKATRSRMFGSESNIRYKYRTANTVLRTIQMPSAASRDPTAGRKLYPEAKFKNFSIQMMWIPPPDLHQFTDWKPACGSRISRDRYMLCSAEVSVPGIEKSLGDVDAIVMKAQMDEYTKAISGTQYKEIHGLITMHLLYTLVKRLQVQLIDEARETPNRRPLYMAGLRWTELGNNKFGTSVLQKLTIPCHYTLLYHLPKSTVMDERRASTFIPEIVNTGEREQAVRLCGLADPLELLRMIGKLLVAHLRRLVDMTRRRPVVPQRSVVFSGKTMYMKCPVDLFHYETPVCNVAGKVDTILWTLNDKTMRFFGVDVERGPSVSSDCGLTIKNIGFNDAGWYVCYRTAIGGREVEKEPAYRHHVDVVRPNFDPPPVEEVYFGLAVCFAWIGFLICLWTFIALARGLLNLLCKDPDNFDKPEVWTSFYDKDAAMDEVDESEDEDDEDDDDDEDEDEEDDEDLDDDEEDLDGKDTFAGGVGKVEGEENKVKGEEGKVKGEEGKVKGEEGKEEGKAEKDKVKGEKGKLKAEKDKVKGEQGKVELEEGKAEQGEGKAEGGSKGKSEDNGEVKSKSESNPGEKEKKD